MVSLCSCEAYMTTLRFLALLLVILVESLAAVHITTWIMVLCALTRLSQVIREGNTHMYQSSCFMGQWFLFIRQLLQIFLKLCPVLFCFAVRYSAIQKQFGFQVGSLEIQQMQTPGLLSRKRPAAR